MIKMYFLNPYGGIILADEVTDSLLFFVNVNNFI